MLNQEVAVEIAGRCVLLGDHTYVVKDGGRMPGVVSLHEHSETQRKPSYFRGHRHLFDTVYCQVYGRREAVQLPALPLLWKPLGDWLLFIFAITSRGPIVLMASDLTLSLATAIELYCVRTCWQAYETFVLGAVIAHGLLQLIALCLGALVWQHHLYLRTQSRALPSEKTVKQVLAPRLLQQFVHLPVLTMTMRRIAGRRNHQQSSTTLTRRHRLLFPAARGRYAQLSDDKFMTVEF